MAYTVRRHTLHNSVRKCWFKCRYMCKTNYYKLNDYKCQHMRSGFFLAKYIPIIFREYKLFRHGFAKSEDYCIKDYRKDYHEFAVKIVNIVESQVKKDEIAVLLPQECTYREFRGSEERKRSLIQCIGDIARHFDCVMQERMWREEMRIRELSANRILTIYY